MNLKQMLENEGLDGLVTYPGFHPERLTFESYEKIQNGYILDTKKTAYRVTVKLYPASTFRNEIIRPAEWVYEAERGDWTFGFTRIPCNTHAEENRYPKLAAWLGTVLIADKNRQTKQNENAS